MFSGEREGIDDEGQSGVADGRGERADDVQACDVAPTADDARLREWIERIVDRDENALASLHAALLGKVHGLALRITRQRHLAEEIAEDVFWQIWRQAPRFDASRGSAMAWVMTIARSRALDALRRQPSREVGNEDALANATEEGDLDPLDLLSAVNDRERLHTALERVDALPRQLLALAFFRGLSHDEIASHTGLPLGTVKSQIRRTLLQLRETLSAAARNGMRQP